MVTLTARRRREGRTERRYREVVSSVQSTTWQASDVDSLFDLTGHVALITGGNSGIGLGMAHALARHGSDVAIWGTNTGKNARAATELAAHGTNVVAFGCDVSDPAAVTRAFGATVEALGHVDSCFANAGIGGDGRHAFHEMPAEEWRRVMSVNLDGCFFTCQAAVAHWVERDFPGSLVVTTSGSAVQGQARGEHYGGSKAAVIAMARGIAVEYSRHGIRANAIHPGWIETEMTGPLVGWDRFNDKVIGRVPLRRWGQPDDFAGVAVYLASDASRWHTGDTFVIDGGYMVF
jgi:NAD(P)-dependent dehydrogenase (short-subunit alcohol dehydrogenase family)